MTNQTTSSICLGGSPAGARISRLCTLTLVAALASGTAIPGFAQATPEAAKPAQQVTEKKPAAAPAPKVIGGYEVHQAIELGGRVTANKSGSSAMWATMVNQGTGMRVLSHSLEMHSLDPSKTPFFNTLSSSSFGYGGDPYDASYLNLSKGRIYDFAGSFRRDRNYFDYNLLANSLLGPAALVPEPDSLHVYNTVRRNTDTLLTILPLSRISFRAGFNHGTHEGPSFSTLHNGGDVQELQWFRNGQDTYTGGVDAKLAKRTTVSYDQFYVTYKGDTNYQLAPTPFKLSDGTPVSLGVDTLATAKCGTAGTSNNTLEVVNGIANPFCSGTTTQNEVAPTRTTFPTEQLRFASHYWDRVSMNGRVTYSGGKSAVNSFNETFIGLNSRTLNRASITTGGLPNGHLANIKRISVNADYGIEAELSKYVSVTDAFNFWNFRIPGETAWNQFTLTGVATVKGPPVVFGTSMLTPLTDPTLKATTTTPGSTPPNTSSGYLGQKNTGNTVMGIFTVSPQVKLSGGWRFNDRTIDFDDDPTLAWHQNWLLLGGVVQPSHAFRLNVNYDIMRAKSANADTTSNTYTREAPDSINHLRVRMSVIPAKWINFAVTGNDYGAKNNDPLVNHLEHNHDVSFAAQIIPVQTLSLDFNYAHDDVFSTTDLCYIYTATATAPLPPGASNAGTCVNSASNPDGASSLNLGNGYYDAPESFFSGSLSYTPAKYFRFNGGASINSQKGQAEQLNPLMVPGALQSKVVTPFSDLLVNIAPQWAWHGNWVHHAYTESGGPGPAPREFHGDVITLGVQYAF
jgi:hypothetical protein